MTRMGRWIVAATLAVPALAFAQQGTTGTQRGTTQQGTQQGTQPGTRGTQQPGQPGQQQPGSTPDQWGTQQGQMGQQGMPGQDVNVFRRAENFQLEGRVAQIDRTRRQITLEREGLPPASLMVPEGAEIKWEGRTANLTEIAPGAEVRATFNLDQGHPVAIQIEASKSKAGKTGGMQQQQPGQRTGQQPGTTGQQPTPQRR